MLACQQYQVWAVFHLTLIYCTIYISPEISASTQELFRNRVVVVSEHTGVAHGVLVTPVKDIMDLSAL